MKFLPLIWAALRRRPARSVLTFASVAIAFTLFGLTIGLNAEFQRLAGLAHQHRLHIGAASSSGLALSQRDQIAAIDGIAHVGFLDRLGGYHRSPGNSIAVLMVGEGFHDVLPELAIAPQDWKRLHANRDGVYFSRSMAARFDVKPGDQFPIIAPGVARADGSNIWIFTILGIVDDIPIFQSGLVLGNYDFLDEARGAAARGRVGQYWVVSDKAVTPETVAEIVDQTFANSALPSRSSSERSLFENVGGPGSNLWVAAIGLASLGIFMILFLTANAVAQSVRERTWEFAIMKTVGFSNLAVVALVFLEAAAPCLLGAAVGLGLANLVSASLAHIFPETDFPPPYVFSPLVLLSAGCTAILLALVSAALPAFRIARLDVVAALARK